MNPKVFDPELGNVMFGHGHKCYAASELLIAALEKIQSELDRVMWNIHQKEYDSPFSNTGNQFKCDGFSVYAYDWSDDSTQEYNFKWDDFEISWYKHLGRDTSVNHSMSPDMVDGMLKECLHYLRQYERMYCPDLYDSAVKPPALAVGI